VIFLISISVIAVIIACCLLIYFNNLVYFVLAFILSVKIGSFVFSLIIKEFSSKYLFKYVVIGVIFLLFLILYYII